MSILFKVCIVGFIHENIMGFVFKCFLCSWKLFFIIFLQYFVKLLFMDKSVHLFHVWVPWNAKMRIFGFCLAVCMQSTRTRLCHKRKRWHIWNYTWTSWLTKLQEVLSRFSTESATVLSEKIITLQMRSKIQEQGRNSQAVPEVRTRWTWRELTRSRCFYCLAISEGWPDLANLW